jgi:hypothetical protein
MTNQEIIKKAVLGKYEYKPKNGKGYKVLGNKEYKIKYNQPDMTFEVIYD